MTDFAASIQKAKAAGYSDAEIAGFLANDKVVGPKVKAAASHGYKPAEIVGFLAKAQPSRAQRDARMVAEEATPGWKEPVRQFARQASLGLSEALPAAAFASVEAVRGRAGLGEAYSAMREAQANQTAARASPLNTAAGVAGGVGSLLYGGGEVGGALKAGQALRAARVGATFGAVGGAANANHLRDIPAGVIGGGIVGGALGGAGAKAAQGVNALAGKAGNALAPLAAKVAAFDRAGVRPSLAAMGGGAAKVAKGIAENAVIGGRPRAHIQGSLSDTEAAVGKMAGRYGQAAQRGAAGDAAQEGITNFNGRFSKRAERIYDKTFAAIDKGQADAAEASRKAASLKNAQGGKTTYTPAPVIEPSETKATLGALGGRVNASKLSQVIDDPRVSMIAAALESGAKDLRFGDLRALRTWVREAQGNEQLRQGMTRAGLQRLEKSLTTDIGSNAERLAGPKAARQLRQADQFYRIGSQRIQGQLQTFVGKGQPLKPEAAFDRIVAAAGDKGGADANRLLALKKSLRPHEWGDVAASTIAHMGRATPGAADQGAFSINRFVTGYHAMSDQGRTLLFGKVGTPLRAEFDNLAHVAGMQKGVERAANHSNSGVSLQNMGTLSALGGAATAAFMGHVAPLVTEIGGLSGGAAIGEAMTNPRFVRWLANAPRNAPAASKAVADHLARLRPIIAANPELAPVYQHIANDLIPMRSAADKRDQEGR